jgi:hypothetical protein
MTDVNDLKQRARAETQREKREAQRVIERWTETIAKGNGHSAWPRAQEQPLMTESERLQLRLDLEAGGMEMSPFLDRLLREGA